MYRYVTVGLALASRIFVSIASAFGEKFDGCIKFYEYFMRSTICPMCLRFKCYGYNFQSFYKLTRIILKGLLHHYNGANI